MTENQNSAQTLELLDRTLEAYGADASRWPADTQGKLQAFISGNRDAQAKLVEARSLDRVLAFAPALSGNKTLTLADRIVATAQHQPRAVTVQAPVVRRQAMKFGNHGFAAAALAASLVLGILFGQNATVSTLAEAFVSNDAGSSSPQVALSDDGDVWTEGDML